MKVLENVFAVIFPIIMTVTILFALNRTSFYLSSGNIFTLLRFFFPNLDTMYDYIGELNANIMLVPVLNILYLVFGMPFLYLVVMPFMYIASFFNGLFTIIFQYQYFEWFMNEYGAQPQGEFIFDWHNPIPSIPQIPIV